MIVVTGGAGFIGSNLLRALNQAGRSDILVVDNLRNGRKFHNLVDCEFLDYVDKDDFLRDLPQLDSRGAIEVMFHLGACSTTTEWDGRYLMQNNYAYSRTLLHHCIERGIRLVYASSAAVYGGGETFVEERRFESPLNAYGYSKFAFDQYVRRLMPAAGILIAGMRYFNVYGPHEAHKEAMASVAFHFHNQLINDGQLRLFCGSDGYDDGEQRRDFVHVTDAVEATMWFGLHAKHSGIFNIGTGRSQTINDVAQAVIDAHGTGLITYVRFPDHLVGRYQSFTEADLTQLRSAGYMGRFRPVEHGVAEYVDWLRQQPLSHR
jgi:ADP-L-glycero-D-manno-heptose 6-epimerase